ncbi:MAG: ATP-binding cassette domain-containing protein [Lachnospiraceae bacterium]|nr:ATP-binding cassette domain-containing protein [Lachnospiraceae bacterium]
MVKIEKLNYGRPEKELYKDVSFELVEDAHYAFIGTNGTGKSTLIDMILNPTEYLYKGKIELDESVRNTRIGYVSQFDTMDDSADMTVFDYISAEFTAIENKIAQLCDRMATETDLEAIFDEYQRVLDEKDSIDGDNYDINIRKQLAIAGLEKLENHKISSLSGGEFKLVQVIKELLLSPKLLFMDEPDVFLDFERINALKELINAHKGTIVVITHNRFLLNHCFDHILHLENSDVQVFEGSYVEYNIELLSTKVELLEIAAREDEEIARQQEILNKARALATYMDNASLGRQVHARQTIVDRLKDRKTKLPFIDIRKPKMEFAFAEPMECETALSLKGYEAAFDEQLLSDVSFDIAVGDKVAIIGRNGTGKTTLLKDIAEAKKSSISFGEGALVRMFSQSIRSDEEDDKSVKDMLLANGMELISEMEKFLGYFGFPEEALHKRMKDFSGGERDLLKLAFLTVAKSNFLILDEPTGHLDVYDQVSLENAVRDYKGTVLIVSHDFYTVVNCVDYVLFVENNSIRRMSVRKFRQMIYENYFDKNYLLKEDKRKELELQINSKISKKDFETAKELLEKIEA